MIIYTRFTSPPLQIDAEIQSTESSSALIPYEDTEVSSPISSLSQEDTLEDISTYEMLPDSISQCGILGGMLSDPLDLVCFTCMPISHTIS